MSCCLSSSRLKITSFLGRYSRCRISTNFLPNEPVPPVTSTTCSDQFINLSLAEISPDLGPADADRNSPLGSLEEGKWPRGVSAAGSWRSCPSISETAAAQPIQRSFSSIQVSG